MLWVCFGVSGGLCRKHRYPVPLYPSPHSLFQPTCNTDLPLSAISASGLIDTCVGLAGKAPWGSLAVEPGESVLEKDLPEHTVRLRCSTAVITDTHTHIFCPSFKVGQGELHLAVFSTTHSLLLSTLKRCL